jgi:GNAT superfamily N-acetyltransferase
MQEMVVLVQECNWHVTGIDVERILLVAIMDGTIVGSSAIRRDGRNQNDLYFESTFVNVGHRRTGIATLLSEKSLELAKRMDAPRAWLTVYRGNRFYIRWFLKHGFKVHGKDEAKDTLLLVRAL